MAQCRVLALVPLLATCFTRGISSGDEGVPRALVALLADCFARWRYAAEIAYVWKHGPAGRRFHWLVRGLFPFRAVSLVSLKPPS